MKFDKKDQKIEAVGPTGFMKDIGGHGPEGTVLANDYGGESVELGKQRSFLKGPGSKDRNNESTFNAEHSGIVKQGMDPGLYKMQSSFHKMGDGTGGAPFHVIEATNTGTKTLIDLEREGHEYKNEAIEEGTKGLEDTLESELGGSPGGDNENKDKENKDKENKDKENVFGQLHGGGGF